MKKNKFFAGIFLICFSFVSLSAYTSLEIRVRFFEGVRKGENDLSYFLPYAYLQPTLIAIIKAKPNPSDELKKIKEIFNLREVNFISGDEHRWRLYKSREISHLLCLHDKKYLISIEPVDRVRKHQFRIQALELNGNNRVALLDTRIVLSRKDTAVIGFKDGHGKPYFVFFRTTGGTVGGIITRTHVIGGVVGCVKKKTPKKR
ncbi:MAG: hypothetical protein JSV96_12040 [Candidatus Aminicenantes bacterium]|nr:MAG: hypothetical protein JSV96_12040 [Candidatus Aminicenantes bacterium]